MKKLVNKINKQTGLSPLSLAILNQNHGCAQLLMQAGAKIYFDKSDLCKDFSPMFVCL